MAAAILNALRRRFLDRLGMTWGLGMANKDNNDKRRVNMKNKRILAGVIAAVMLMIMLPVGIASASEVVLTDIDFDNTFANDSLDTNWWGNVSQDIRWQEGKLWGTGWGATGALRDAKDGSLAFYGGYNAAGEPASGEVGLSHAILGDALADNSTLEYTIKFRTPDKAPKKTGGQVWFTFSSYDKDGAKHNVTPLALKIDSSGIEDIWAISQYYPNGSKNVYGKEFDRDPNHLAFDWGKDYTVKVTLKPSLEGNAAVRLVAEVWEDGKSIGIGIVNEWAAVTIDMLKNPYMFDLNFPINDPITPGAEADEDLLYLKGLKIKAIQPDVAIGAAYFPKDGCVDAAIDTEVYADFESEINEVEKTQVKVDGGASVKSVSMSNGNKRVNIELDGLKANTAYTVSLSGIKGIIAGSSFDYKWSFTTDSGVEAGEPYFGSSKVMLDTEADGVDLSSVVSLTDEDYLSGDAWGTSNTDDIGSAIDTDSKSLMTYFKGGDSDISRKFPSLSDGESLKISGDVKIRTMWGPVAGERYDNNVELIGADGSKLVLFGGRGNPYWWEFVILHQGDYKSGWDRAEGTQVDVTTTGKVRPNSSTDWAEVSNNDTVLSNEIMYDVANNGKNYSSMEGVVNFTVTAAPNASDDSKYDVTLTFIGDNIETTSVKTVDKAFVQKLDAIRFFTHSGWEEEAAVLTVSNLKIGKTSGKEYPVVGENVVNVPYTNLSGSAFDTDVLVVERDADTNAIIKATIVKKTGVTGESGVMECEFNVKENGSKVSVYVLNSADGMILLSDGKTFDVGE